MMMYDPWAVNVFVCPAAVAVRTYTVCRSEAIDVPLGLCLRSAVKQWVQVLLLGKLCSKSYVVDSPLQELLDTHYRDT